MTRRVAITGVSGGIGFAAAAAFREAGWAAAGVDVVEPRHGAVDEFLRLDLGETDVEARLRDWYASLGSLDALVNTAGIQNTGSALDTADEEWERIMAVNLRGAFRASRAAQPLLASNRGAVVNVASVHAIATTPGAAPYAASKAGLASLTRSLALEWAPAVRVNCVLPGAIDTPMLAEGLTRAADRPVDAGRAALEKGIPLGHIGQPRDVAQAILFLADGERSAFITGQSLVVDGGVLASLATD